MSQPQNNSPFTAAMQKVQPTLQSAWVSTRPPLVQVLKGIVKTLQSAIGGLEQQIQVADRAPTVQPLDLTPVKNIATGFWTKSQPIWVKVLAFVRSKLSPDTSGKLSDRALSGVLAGVLLLVLTVTTHLPNGRATAAAVKPNRTPTASAPSAPLVSRAPAPITAPIAPPTPPPIAQQFPVDVGQVSTPFPSDLSSPTALSPTALSPTALSPIAPKVPAIPAPVIPAPKPAVKLTANQKLLAKLQATTAVYSQPDADNLAQAVRPNKMTKTLEVTLTPAWSQLSPTQQDQLASDLFSQAQTLRFKTLELTDTQNTLLARSPIVGADMVILSR